MAKTPKVSKTAEDQKRDEVLARMLNTPPKPHKDMSNDDTKRGNPSRRKTSTRKRKD